MFFLFMTGSMYFLCSSANKQTRFHVNGIKRASRLDMQTFLDFIQWLTCLETRYTHCSGEKQNFSKTWINLTSYDTFNQTVRHSVTLLTLCVGKFCILMSSRLLYPRISRTPNFERFFPWKKCGLYAGKYGRLVTPYDKVQPTYGRVKPIADRYI